MRAAREGEEERPFNLAMLTRLVWSDWRVLRDVAIGSIAITVLSVLPILMVMRTISTVMQYKSSNTLALVTVVMVLCVRSICCCALAASCWKWCWRRSWTPS